MGIKYIDEFRDPSLAPGIVRQIEKLAIGTPLHVMEVCGTHTMAVSRSGIRSLLKGTVNLISGPGCPVCVTPAGYIDAATELSRNKDITIATFGDMMKVPGNFGSLESARGRGARVEVVYSPLDALEIAEREQAREVVFLGVGFETTIPAIAGAIVEAKKRGISNFSVLSSARTIPEAMEALVVDPEVKIEAFLCPAHVSTIIGTKCYEGIAEKYRIPCVVAGFEPIDILLGILMILKQVREGVARVENEYARVATYEGNKKAVDLIYEVFEKSDAEWRGIGVIPGSGLRIKDEWKFFDGEKRFSLHVRPGEEKSPCRCGDVLKGIIAPLQCPLFETACSPEFPMGPCMVSSEGTCAAYYKYERTGGFPDG